MHSKLLLYFHVLAIVTSGLLSTNAEADTRNYPQENYPQENHSQQPVKCSDPEIPEHGSYDYRADNSGVGAQVKYTCDEDYHLQGESTLYCTEEGIWTSEKPHCGLVTLTFLDDVVSCGYPGSTNHCYTNISESSSLPGTVAAYECESSYTMFGPTYRTCTENGTWFPEIQPYCALNVAEKRLVAAVSDNVDTTQFTNRGKNIIDGKILSCSTTTASNTKVSYWIIDLLEVQKVDAISLIFADLADTEPELSYGVYEDDHFKMEKYEFDLKKASKTTSHGESKTMHFTLHKPMEMRYLKIEILPAAKTVIRFCEAKIISKSASSKLLCSNEKEYNEERSESATSIVNNTCYTFFYAEEDTWAHSNERCKKIVNGYLVSNILKDKYLFLKQQLSDISKRIDANFWIGGYRPPVAEANEEYIKHDEKGAHKEIQWFWIQNNHTIDAEHQYWGYDQPNNYPKLPACIEMVGELQWAWSDSECDHRSKFICEHDVLSCGIPDRNENIMISEAILSTNIGDKITYHCPHPFALEGYAERVCEASGHWSGVAPKCITKDSEGHTGDHDGDHNGDHNGDHDHGSGHSEKQTKGIKAGVIVAIVLGILAAIIIIIVIIIVVIYKKKRSGSKTIRYSKDSESAEALDVSSDKGKGSTNYSSTGQGEDFSK